VAALSAATHSLGFERIKSLLNSKQAKAEINSPRSNKIQIVYVGAIPRGCPACLPAGDLSSTFHVTSVNYLNFGFVLYQ
jgi:hypothetical protein